MKSQTKNLAFAIIGGILVVALLRSIVLDQIVKLLWSVPCDGGTDPNVGCATYSSTNALIVNIIFGIVVAVFVACVYKKNYSKIALATGAIISLYFLLMIVTSRSYRSQNPKISDILWLWDNLGWFIGGVLAALALQLPGSKKKTKRAK